MKKIFENAKFGKTYKTRDGSKAIFICQRTNSKIWDLTRPYACIVEGYGEIWNYSSDGRLYIGDGFETENDIISEWKDEIDEEELDKLAEEYCKKRYGETTKTSVLMYDIDEAYIAGYRKALEQ